MMRLFFGFSFFFLLLHLAFTASARPRQENAPPTGMNVTLMRSGMIDCLPNCVEWIAFEGKFDKNTPKQFRETLALAQSARPSILISSGGGDVDAAMDIGRIVRAKGFDVIVTRAEALAPDPALAADNRGIGVKPPAVVKRILAYLKEMGLPADEIIKLMKTAAPENMSWLSRPSLEHTTLLATDSAIPQIFLGLGQSAVARATQESAPASASSERVGARSPVNQFAKGVGVTRGQIMILTLAFLTMGAAMAVSLRRRLQLNAPPPERRDPSLGL